MIQYILDDSVRYNSGLLTILFMPTAPDLPTLWALKIEPLPFLHGLMTFPCELIANGKKELLIVCNVGHLHSTVRTNIAQHGRNSAVCLLERTAVSSSGFQPNTMDSTARIRATSTENPQHHPNSTALTILMKDCGDFLFSRATKTQWA